MTALALARRHAGARWLAELSSIAPRLAGTLGTSGASAVLGVISGTVAARMLGPDTRGDLAQLLLWPQMFVTLGILGVELASTYFSADPARRRNVPATGLGIAAVQTLVLVPVYLAFVPLLYPDHLHSEAFFMALLIPMYLAGAVSIDCLAGTLRFREFNAVRIALPIVYCAAVLALAAAGALTPATGAAAYLAAHGVADLLALGFVWRGGGLGRFDRALGRDMLQYGVRAHPGRLTPQALGLDIAIIALILSSRDVGLYVAATAFLAAPSLVASSIGMVVFPQVSAAHQSGARQRLGATFALYAAAVVALAAMLFIAAPVLVTLFFGDRYADAALSLRLLSLASVALALRSFPSEVLRGVGRPGLTSLAEVSNWLLFAAFVPLGAAVGGLAGAAAAVAIASTVSLAVLAALVWRTGMLPVARASLTPQVDGLG